MPWRERARSCRPPLAPDTRRLLGLFHTGNMDGVLDRKFLKGGSVKRFPEQPDLTEQTAGALDILSQQPNGFFLMVESGMIDKYTPPARHGARGLRHHPARQRGAAGADWAKARGDDTLILVVADHNHPVSMVGTIDDDMTTTPNVPMRERVRIYDKAGFPNYPAPDEDGYPSRVDVSRRLAMFSASVPDHYETFRPRLDNPNDPTVAGKEPGTFEANDTLQERARRGAAARQPAEVSQCQRAFRRGRDPHRDRARAASACAGRWTTPRCSGSWPRRSDWGTG